VEKHILWKNKQGIKIYNFRSWWQNFYRCQWRQNFVPGALS